MVYIFIVWRKDYCEDPYADAYYVSADLAQQHADLAKADIDSGSTWFVTQAELRSTLSEYLS